MAADAKAAVQAIRDFAERQSSQRKQRMAVRDFCKSFGLLWPMADAEFATLISRIGRATVSVRVVDATRAPSTLLLAGSFGFFEHIFFAGGEVTFCVSRYMSEDLAARMGNADVTAQLI